MTDPEPSTDEPATAPGAATQDGFPPAASRRRVLHTLALGGSLGLAGCGQSGSPTSTNTAGVTDQTFRAPTRNDPEKTTFFGRNSFNHRIARAYAAVAKENAGYNLQRVLWEPGVWADGIFVGTAESHYTWLEEPIEITPTEVTVTIRDDARWSDGQPITGTDIACLPLQQSLQKQNPPYYAKEGSNEPTSVYAAFDDVAIADKSVTYTSSAGHFDAFWEIDIINKLGPYFGPHHLPTHIEPYATYADAVIETVARAQAGEINPWKGYNDPRTEPDDPHKASLIKKHLNERAYVEKFSKPDNVLATGAWDLVELRGTEFVFQKNDYHRNADRLNFETLVLEYTPSTERMHAALNADRLDFSSAAYGPPTPQAVVESFPENIQQLQVPGNQYTGHELALNFDHPALEQRAVRAALMYALDQDAIATNIHPTATPPVTTPGGDCWDATAWASQEWIDDTLITYETDRDRAASLMREAGLTKDGDQWVGADGDPLTLTLATSRETPRWEPTVASQLSQFGIQSSVQTLTSSMFSDRVERGEFPLWPSSVKYATNLAPYTLLIWLQAVTNPSQYGIFPEEQFETGGFSQSGAPHPRTEDRYDVFTIEAPPIGQPDGPLEEYHPAAFSLFFSTNPPEEEFTNRVKTGMWLANWFLPTIPLTKRFEQFFIDDAHWLWPKETPWWESFTSGSAVLSGSLFGQGTIRANPDNPENS